MNSITIIKSIICLIAKLFINFFNTKNKFFILHYFINRFIQNNNGKPNLKSTTTTQTKYNL